MHRSVIGASRTFDNKIIAAPATQRYSGNMTTQLRELRELPISERIQLVEDLWDSIAEDAPSYGIPDEQTASLEARLDALEADPLQGTPWDVAKQRIIASR